MGTVWQLESWTIRPEWLVENGYEIPKLTSSFLYELAHDHPQFVIKYITDFTGTSTIADFWTRMIKESKTFEKLFIDNMFTLTNKSEIRDVFGRFPKLIMLLEPSHISCSKLSAKEWVLLASRLKTKHTKILKDWEISDVLKEELRFSSMTEILTGESTKSTTFSRALSTIAEIQEPEDKLTDTDEIVHNT
jgi:hypothetical protein